ncbi:hypothetical protein PLESTF_000709300 [Pleodorina starrii]|nr:hypothetical protein PLESTM_001798600 [Pleodorina starrii]GLC68565.1 hypothetical protein PLESTF_000709300 [Pleodorina starrii]
MPSVFSSGMALDQPCNFTHSTYQPQCNLSVELNKVLKSSIIKSLRGPEMVACVSADHSAAWTSWSGACEKRRRLNTTAAAASTAQVPGGAPDAAAAESDRPRPPQPPRLQRPIKQEPPDDDSAATAAHTWLYGTAPPPCSQTQEQQHGTARLLACSQSCYQQDRKGYFQQQPHSTAQWQPHPHQQQQQQQQQQQRQHTACSAAPQAAYRQREYDSRPPATCSSDPCLPWRLPNAPFLPLTSHGRSHSHSQPQHHRTVASGAGSAAGPSRASSTWGSSWRSAAATITTGTAPSLGPAPITTGVVCTGTFGPHVRTSSAPPSVTSGFTGAGVVTVGGSRPATAPNPLKRRLPTATTPTSQPSSVLDELLGLPTVASTTLTSRAATTSSESVFPAQGMTHGSVSPWQDADSVSSCGGWGAPESSGQAAEGALPEASAPSTPPRSPGCRVTSELTPQPTPPPTVPQAPQPTPTEVARAPGGESNSARGPSAALEVLGFRMLGIELAAAPHACPPGVVAGAAGPAAVRKGQVVHVLLRLVPVAGGCGASNPAADAEPPQRHQSTPAPQPRSETTWTTLQYTVGRQQQQQQDAQGQATQQQQQLQRQQELQQQQQCQRPLAVSVAAVLPGEQPGAPQQTRSISSSDSLPESTTVTQGWMPEDAASEPVLPGLDRLLCAAAAAAAAATSASEQLVSPPPQLPALHLPRIDPETYFEPDGSLLRGSVLQTACVLIRLAKLLRGGLSVSLPWCEPDAATCPDSGAPGSTTAAAGAAAGTAGKCPSTSAPVPIGLPQSLAVVASGRRSVPLSAILKLLTDFVSAARALQRAEAEARQAGAAAAAVAGGEDAEYRALWPLMRRGLKCAEALMVHVERTLTGDVASGLSLSPAGSLTASV